MILKIKRFIRLNTSLVLYSCVLLIALVGLFVGLIPSVQKTIVLIQDIQTLNDEVTRMQTKLTMLTSLDQSALEQNSMDVLSAVPTDKSVETLLSTVEAVASKHDLVISDLSVEGIGNIASGSGRQLTKPEGNVLTEMITVEGELLQIRNFLADCVKVRRLLRVRGLELSAIPQVLRLTARLSIEVFYAALPTTLGKASDSLAPFSQQELDILEKIRSYPIMFPTNIGDTSPQSSLTVGVELTTPVLSDPFFPKKTQMITATPSATPKLSPMPTQLTLPSVSSVSATPKKIPSPTIKPSPSPTP